MKSKKVVTSATPMVANFLESVSDVTRNASCKTEVKSRITHRRVTEIVANALFLANFTDNLHPLPVLPMCERVRHIRVLYSATNGKDRKRDGSICTRAHNKIARTARGGGGGGEGRRACNFRTFLAWHNFSNVLYLELPMFGLIILVVAVAHIYVTTGHTCTIALAIAHARAWGIVYVHLHVTLSRYYQL